MNPVDSHYGHFRELLRFVRFTDEDQDLLRKLAVYARPEYQRIASTFYERTREHEDAHAVFESDEQIERLHRSLVSWLDRVLTGPYDESYCAQTARIGQAHVKVGLPERYMFSAMSLVRVELQHVACAHMPENAARVCDALGRILDVELAVMTHSYSLAEVERRTRAIRQQKRDADADARRWECAMQHADEVIIGIDHAGHITLFNHAAERITGYAAEEVIGTQIHDLTLGSEDGSFVAIMEQALRALPSAATALELPLRTRTGKLRHLAGRLCRSDEVGDLALLVMARDVTSARAAEAQLRRTEKLAAVGTLAAGLAHEIRNPLNGAQLHLTFLKRALSKSNHDGELFAAADVVSTEITRLGDLVSEFLQFARPQPLQRKATAVQELCARCLDLVCDVAAAAGVQLCPKLPRTPIQADIDAAKIEQVLLNLLRNAIEAMSAGGTATLTAVRRPRHVLIEVEDNGCGLGADAPVWDAFYSTKEGGTGLGLAIAHRIVSDHGGAISVESRPGRTVFRVELPLADPEHLPASLRPGFARGDMQ